MQKYENVSLSKTLLRTIGFSARNKKLFALTITLTLLITAFNLITPYIFSLFFNYAQKNLASNAGINSQFLLLGGAYFGVAILNTITTSADNYIGYKWWLKTQQVVFLASYGHINSLSLNFFEENPTGKIRERIWNGAQAITNVLDEVFTSILPQILFIISSVIILFFVQPIFALMLVVLAPIYFTVIYFFNRKLKPIRAETRLKWEALSTQITESIYNTRTVKTNAKEGYHYKIIGKSAQEAFNEEMKWSKINVMSKLSYGTIIDITRVTVLIYGFYLVITGNILIGTLILIWQYVNRSLDPIAGMVKDVAAVQKNLVDTQLTFSYLDTQAEIVDSNDAVTRNFKHPKITFSKVNFSYKEEKTVKDLSLEIPGGSTLAIVGKSGSGKSTLIKLLLRLYDINSGKILIDRAEINNLRQKSLRDNISVVMQDSVIFNDTAANNIRYTKLNASKTEIIKAAKLAGADKFIDALPDGYNTILGEKGVKLSGGEQQRINIARAFLKNAPILILDEATSSLDSEIEQAIQKSMWELAKDRTTIIIAHRLSTVMKADLIVVMDKGKIVEQGTHADLVQHKGIYSKLFEIQSGGYLK